MPINSPFAMAWDARKRTDKVTDNHTAPSPRSASLPKFQPFSRFCIPSCPSVEHLHLPLATTCTLLKSSPEPHRIESPHYVIDSHSSPSVNFSAHDTAPL